MAIHWFRSVWFCLWIFTWCYCSAPVFIKQQAVCLDAGVKHDFALSPPPVVQQSFQCLWAVKCTHATEVLETPDHSGIMLTDPLSRFPQSLLSHKEQCHVEKFKSMRSAFCLLFLACQKVLLQTPSRTNLFALTQTRPSAKQDPPDTLVLSTWLYQRTVQTSSSRWTASLWHNHFQTAMPWCKTGPLDPCPLHCTWFHIRTSAEFISVTWNNRQTKWKISERDRNTLCLTFVHYSTYWFEPTDWHVRLVLSQRTSPAVCFTRVSWEDDFNLTQSTHYDNSQIVEHHDLVNTLKNLWCRNSFHSQMQKIKQVTMHWMWHLVEKLK